MVTVITDGSGRINKKWTCFLTYTLLKIIICNTLFNLIWTSDLKYQWDNLFGKTSSNLTHKFCNYSIFSSLYGTTVQFALVQKYFWNYESVKTVGQVINPSQGLGYTEQHNVEKCSQVSMCGMEFRLTIPLLNQSRHMRYTVQFHF